MYKLIANLPGLDPTVVHRLSDGMYIPFDPANIDYQRFLDDINKEGVAAVDGVIPDAVIQEAASKQFNQQLTKYLIAVARLSQYVLSEGRPEVKEMLPSGETKINPTTGEREDVLVETVTQTAIEPLPATVEIWEQVEGSTELVKKIVRNPAIVQDEADRAAAQAIVDATPEEVKAAA